MAKLNAGARPVGRRVITVEAKLRDWTRAFTQARKQLRSADAAYIALDEARAGSALGFVDDIAARGIGVITVDAATGRHRVVVRRRRVTVQQKPRSGALLLAERCLELVLDGRAAGQVAPIFGWTPPDR